LGEGAYSVLLITVFTVTLCCNNPRKNKFMALKKLDSSGSFFSYFVVTLICVSWFEVDTVLGSGYAGNSLARAVARLYSDTDCPSV